MLAADSASPRVTCYDDTPGPTAGERIELSARVLANWVAKAANLLQDELDGAPATTVGIDLPAHWRSLYWALAAWSVGSTVVVGAGARSADVVVTDSPEAAGLALEENGGAVLVTLAMLARGNPATPPDVIDEAHDLASQGDVFDPAEEPDTGMPALVADGVTSAYADVVVPQPDWGSEPRVAVAGTLAQVLPRVLSAWAAGGSVVLLRGATGDQSSRLDAEGVTLDLR